MQAGPGSNDTTNASAMTGRALLCLFCLVLGGCNEADMVVQPKYKPLQASAFFADGRSSRPIEPGTIARGELTLNTAFGTGTTDDGKLVGNIPLKGFDPLETLGVDESRAARKAALLRGRERFNIFCAPCHARTGDGDGIIVQRGFTKPPSLHEPRLREAPVGHFFHVMTHGFGAMYSYASRIPAGDRWAIVAYIRALQLSRNAALTDVPAEERAALELKEAPAR